MSAQTDKTNDYIVTRTGWVAGVFCRAGAVVQLTLEQAAYENVQPAPKPRRKRARKAAS